MTFLQVEDIVVALQPKATVNHIMSGHVACRKDHDPMLWVESRLIR